MMLVIGQKRFQTLVDCCDKINQNDENNDMHFQLP